MLLYSKLIGFNHFACNVMYACCNSANNVAKYYKSCSWRIITKKQKLKENVKHQWVFLAVNHSLCLFTTNDDQGRAEVGIFSGVRGGGAADPRLERFRANSVFRASRSCSKILNDKKYFNRVKNFRQTLFFRASASWPKFWMIKNIY